MKITNINAIQSRKLDDKKENPEYWTKINLEVTDQAKLKNTSSIINVTIDVEIEYQEFIGFGGSFTESSGYNLSFLNKKEQEQLVDAYFGKDGLGYTLCRTHIQSCDFALGSYSYVVDKDDKSLKTFTIDRDRVYLIPFIKLAQKRTTTPFKILASPWSPPAFMKSNNSMSYGGMLKKEYAHRWALMIAKYIEEYKKEDINIWAISSQNEPEATQTWDSCLYTAEEEGDFIYEHLIPTLCKRKLSPKILAWDHNRDQLFVRSKLIYKHPAAEYIWGSGFHWYEEIYKERPMHEEVEKTHNAFPNKHLIMTEGCQEFVGLNIKMGDWNIGERYARNIIGDLNAWCEGWIDWNMLLNEEGGPNHVQNLCDALIKVNTNTKKLMFSNSYYYMGHFSKFIRPGAKRIKHTIDSQDIMLTTWKDKNTIVCVLLNINNKTKRVRLQLGNNILITSLERHSIQTISIEIT